MPLATKTPPLPRIPSTLLVMDDLASLLVYLLLFGPVSARERMRSEVFIISTVHLYLGVLPPVEWSTKLLLALYGSL